jgi:hypothetical protein
MRHTVRLSAQEQHLRGATAIERWEHAQALGFDALELRAAGDGRFAARLPELKAAAASKCCILWGISIRLNGPMRWCR